MNPPRPTVPMASDIKSQQGGSRVTDEKMEVVQDIPMRAPDPSPASGPAVVELPKKHITEEGDQELDNILKDVSREVRKPSAPAPADRARTGSKKVQKEADETKRANQPKQHVMPIVVAVMIAGILVAAAIYTFKQSGGA